MEMDQFTSTTKGRLRARWLASNALRITHATLGETSFPADRPWMKYVFTSQPVFSSQDAELRLAVVDDCVCVLNRSGDTIFHEAYPARLGISRRRPYISLDIPKTELRAGIEKVDQGIRLGLAIEPDESFYGWGEWFNAFQRQAGSFHLRIRDAIALLQGSETYSGIPIFFSSRGYAFFLLNSHTSHWRIQPGKGVLEIDAHGPGADYMLIYGPEFKRIIQTYTMLTGRPPLLPRWAFGLWVTSYPQDHQQLVLEHVRSHRDRQIPLDAVILDYQWEQGYHNFKWRRSIVPDPKGLISELNSLGVRLGLIQTPFVNKTNRPLQRFLLNKVARNLPSGTERDDERALPEYSEARQQGYLAHSDARWWFGSGGMVDFSNPQAAAWWNAMMKPLYEQGVSFFKNDDGEYLPESGHSALGMVGGEFHNIFGFFYGRAIYEGMHALDDGEVSRRPLIYSRSVWAGSQRYPALFLGDQKPTFEGIHSTIRAGLNLGLLGFAYWTPDVFGLDGKTTPETHMRYAQWALLAPVARYFWRPPHIDDTRFPWSHGSGVEANFRKYTELRYRLLPYYTMLAWQAYQTGLPLMRPLVLEYQDETRLAGVDDQVLLGQDLMLCPVITAGAPSRRIVLPQGDWHDYWTNQTWQGPAEIDYPAPLDRLPLLVRGGAVIPMGPVMPYIPQDHQFDHLQLNLWPPFDAEVQLFDDDGYSTAYQQGAYGLTALRVHTRSDGRLQIEFQPAEGDYDFPFQLRHVELLLHRSPSVGRVKINGIPVDTWNWDAESGLTSIDMQCDVSEKALIEVEWSPM